MAEQIAIPKTAAGEHGWRVTFAGMGINLALGILYTWSIISEGIPEEWGWSQGDKSLPYSVCCLVFCLVMVPAGRFQDKFGPRVVAAVGGVLVGLGFVIASMTTSLAGFVLGFGVIAGAGIGCGYASATPPAVKWFPAAKTGLIAGIVVSGFGLASVYAAPLAKFLLVNYGLQKMMLILGLAFLVIITGLKTIITPLWFGLSQMLQAPDPDLMQLKFVQEQMAAKAAKEQKKVEYDKDNFTPKEMLCTPQFYALWFMYACGAGAGLMIISVAKKIVLTADVAEAMAVAAVVGLAIGNGAGRILAGMLSDKIGRKATLFICFVLQAVLIFLLSQAQGDSILASGVALIIIAALIGANYGSNLSLFPSFTKDFYGLKNFGMNYGLVFTAWGVGGFMLAKLAGVMYDKHQTFTFAYYGASALLVLAAIMVFFLKTPRQKPEIV
ncbi:MAG: L-lactate MFS transporter [Planctomycetota bacterium]|jgi:OFA family oxalate/formate antiporter-like MFS transporter